MNVEVIKTYILTILVIISLLLTFAIWNYQPNYDFLYNDQTEYVNEVNLGGEEKTKRDIIVPDSIVFHDYNNYYGFKNPYAQQEFYERMTEWTLHDPYTETIESIPNYDYQIDIHFPQKLPIEIVKNLYDVNEEDELPTWSFQQLYISVDPEDESMKAHFLSINNEEQLTFTINSASDYKEVWPFFGTNDQLEPYVIFEDGKRPIYLPANKPEIRGQTFATDQISPTLLVNALFPNKDDVTPNFGEQYYTDGQRGMRRLEDGNLAEFINPIHLKVHHTNSLELLNLSLKSINEHKGWTDDYRLVNINEADDTIRYRMYYNDLPVFNNHELSVIEQSWRDQDLHLYQRPLFKLDSLFPTDITELASGEDLIYYLNNNEIYSPENIENIQLGYYLRSSESSDESISFKPSWFIKYNDRWLEVSHDDVYDLEEGGG